MREYLVRIPTFFLSRLLIIVRVLNKKKPGADLALQLWKNVILLWLIVMTAGTAITPAYADAVMQILPNKIVFDGQKRSGTITVVNSGDATGLYAIRWVDNGMARDGSLIAWDQEGRAPWSIQSHIRYAPRRMVLRPGQRQVVKIALKRRSDVAEGEYFSHIRIQTLDSNVEATQKAQEENTPNKRSKITITARHVVAIPVIWRNGPAKTDAALETAKLDTVNRKIILTINRRGKYSARGHISIFTENADQPVSLPTHVVIYPTIDQKFVEVRLKKDTDFSKLIGHHVRIIYSSEDKEKGSVFFDTSVGL